MTVYGIPLGIGFTLGNAVSNCLIPLNLLEDVFKLVMVERRDVYSMIEADGYVQEMIEKLGNFRRKKALLESLSEPCLFESSI